MKVRLITALISTLIITATASAEDFKWRLGSQLNANDPTTLLLENFAERVGERSEGRLKIDVITLQSIGLSQEDALRAASQGIVDAVHVTPYLMARDEPRLLAFLPHTVLFDRMDNLKIADFQYEISKEIYGDWDLVPIARTTLGGGSATQQIVCTKPVNSLEGLRKVKLRHFDKIGIKAMNALGVSTQTLPSSEVYISLRTGVIDCTFYAPLYTKSESLYEVAPYMSDIGYASIASPFVIAAREDKWDALPQDLKDIVTDVGEEMFEEQLTAWRTREEEKAAEEFLVEHGMTALEPFSLEDRQEIRGAMIDAWRDEVEKLGPGAVEIYEKISAKLADL